MENKKHSRTAITSYIGRQLCSRQEFIPLIGKYIDLAKVEPLHSKNNTVKEMFVKLLRVVLHESKIPQVCKSFNTINENSLFVTFIKFVRKDMDCNYLGKKVVAWFNEHNTDSDAKTFAFRFRGKESKCYCRTFPQLIMFLYKSVRENKTKIRLTQIFYQSLNLRKLISYSVRITDIKPIDIIDMENAGRKLFVSCCLFDRTVTPSMWNFCNVAPVHAKECMENFSFGLGIHTMEGREQKHQQVKKYSAKTTYQQRWEYILRHEFIHLIYLRLHGFDTVKYKKHPYRYIPPSATGFCDCSLILQNGKCKICDSTEMCNIASEVHKFL